MSIKRKEADYYRGQPTRGNPQKKAENKEGVAEEAGVEPTMTESKSVALPLGYSSI